jgi:hypothetical protein
LVPLSAMLVIEKATVPVLVRVMAPGVPVEPTFTLPSERLPTDSLPVDVPLTTVKLTVCVTAGAATFTVRVEVPVPVEIGLAVTVTVQLAPAASVVPQALVSANHVACPPVMPTEVMESVPVPVLVTVTVCGRLVVFSVTVPKFREVAERLSTGSVPVPVIETVAGLPGALVLKESVLERAPVTVGSNFRVTAQLAPAVSVAPQVFVEIGKSVASVSVTLLMVMVTLPLFCRVTV